MQISTIKINFEKPLATHLIGPKWTFWEQKFWISLQKNLVPRRLSHRENVRTLKFWRKSKDKKQKKFENLPRAYKDLILVKKKFNIISCLCTFKVSCWNRIQDAGAAVQCAIHLVTQHPLFADFFQPLLITSGVCLTQSGVFSLQFNLQILQPTGSKGC